eukprot:3101113-Pleurochrysis_carterae.AAC.1
MKGAKSHHVRAAISKLSLECGTGQLSMPPADVRRCMMSPSGGARDKPKPSGCQSGLDEQRLTI